MTRIRLVRRASLAALVVAAVVVPVLGTTASAGSDRTLRPVSGAALRTAPTPRASTAVREASARTPGVPVSDAALARMASARPSGTPTRLQGFRNAPSPSTTVTTSFAGISKATANTLDPPDTIVAKSGLRVIEGVNSVLRMSSTAGALVSQTTLNTFFGASSTFGQVFDPKVYYDRNAANQRFYVVGLQVAGDGDSISSNNFSRIWIAVSRSTNPTSLASTQWCRYFIDSRRNVGTTSESWGDYPGLGVGATALTITTNQFQFLPSGNFTFAIIRGLNKSVLSNNAGACPAGSSVEMDTFQATSTLGSTAAFTIQPAQHYTSPSSFAGTSNPAYFVSSVFGTSSVYRVWQLRNFPGPSSMRVVNLAAASSNTVPPGAPGGSGALIDTGDDRVLQVAGLGNTLTSSNTTGCDFGGGALESCNRVVRFVVGQSSTGALTAGINQQNLFGGGAGNFFYLPGVAVNNSLSAAVPFQWSSSVQRLTGLLTTKTSAASFTSTSFLTPAGTCVMNTGFDPNKGRYRAGDYTGVQTDTDGVGFWLAAERALVINSACRWSTQVVRATT